MVHGIRTGPFYELGDHMRREIRHVGRSSTAVMVVLIQHSVAQQCLKVETTVLDALPLLCGFVIHMVLFC